VTSAYVFLLGLALGFSLVIPPGPMNALIASRAVRSVRGGVATGFGAMTADAVLGALVYSLHLAVDLGSVVRWVEVGGAAIMAFFAYRVFAREARPVPTDAPPDVRVFSEALVVGVTNPFQILWWLTAGLAFAYLGGLLLLAGLFSAIAIWVMAFPWALHRSTRRYARAPQAVALVSGALLAGFAVYFVVLAAGVAI
jgi:threonine/homoserine/homoserine lactone efflux protein